MVSFLQSSFIDVLNMSITAAYAILLLLPVRLLFRKFTKLFSYSLWLIVYLRLVLPFSFSSPFSFFIGNNSSAGKIQYIPSNITMMAQPEITNNISSIDISFQAILPQTTPFDSVNQLQIIFLILSIVWLMGMMVMLMHGSTGFFKLKQATTRAMHVEGNVYESDSITSPFVLGIFRPKIYLPVRTQLHERSLFLMHEQTHIRRLDHIVKPLAYAISCIHWFNPLVWLAFNLMSKDMEMSCDEQVLSELGPAIKHDYCNSLLSLAAGKPIKDARMPAFGESNVKARIKNILAYRRQAAWPVIAALAVFAVVLTGLMSNPLKTVSDGEDFSRDIHTYRTLFLGDNSNVVQIVERLPVPLDFSRTQVQLYTTEPPNIVEVAYRTTPENMVYFSQPDHQTIFERNAVLMFALIGNTDEVRFILGGGNDEVVIEHNRTWANETMQRDVWQQTADFESFAQLNRDIIRKFRAPQILTELLNSGRRTTRQSVNDVPTVSEYTRLEVEGETYFVYRKSGRYYVEKPYQFIDEISQEAWWRIGALALSVDELNQSN